MNSLAQYINKDRERIKGWLSWVDAEIIGTLLRTNKEEISVRTVLEIGIHRGKSAILFLHGPNVEKLIAVDLFENQFANTGKSGFGISREFTNNLATFSISFDKVSVISADSTLLSRRDILKEAGEVDLVHIDGGHTKEVVRSDLNLAKDVLAKHGVLIVDDYMRPDWPEVGQAVCEWLQKNFEFEIFCIGHNKVYITRKEFMGMWLSSINNNSSLLYFIRKTYLFTDVEVPIFFHYFSSEWSRSKKIFEYIRYVHPLLFIRFKRAKAWYWQVRSSIKRVN